MPGVPPGHASWALAPARWPHRSAGDFCLRRVLARVVSDDQAAARMAVEQRSSSRCSALLLRPPCFRRGASRPAADGGGLTAEAVGLRARCISPAEMREWPAAGCGNILFDRGAHHPHVPRLLSGRVWSSSGPCRHRCALAMLRTPCLPFGPTEHTPASPPCVLHAQHHPERHRHLPSHASRV